MLLGMAGRGYVLAGGGSRRMGSDKALLVWGGKTLLQRAVETLESLGLEVAVITGAGRRFPSLTVRRLEDELPGRGPLGGLHSALRDSEGEPCYLLACDLPLIPGKLFQMMERLRQDCDCVVPSDSRGRLHPLCAVYSQRCLPEVERLLKSSRTGMHDLAQSKAVKTRIISPGGHGLEDVAFTNINTLEDFENLNRLQL